MCDSTSSFLFSVIFFLLNHTSDSLAQSEGSSFSKMPFVKLDGNIIQAIAVPNILQCCWKCDRLPECLSLNVADVPDKDGLYECQMLRTETNQYSGLLKPSQHYHHYTRFTDNACSSVQCLNGGACQPDGYFNFRCSCPQGFKGNFCHKTSYKWMKINTSPVCFGAKNSTFGRFYIIEKGKVIKVKLVHRSGFVTCINSRTDMRSNWGCAGALEYLSTIITSSKDEIILSQAKFLAHSQKLEYHILGFNSRSPKLVFKDFTSPHVVTAGQEYRLWYGEDLSNINEHDNEGQTCADVYMFGLFG